MHGTKIEPPDWYFTNIAALSQSARHIHIVYVGFLAYCALTMWSTPARKFILNEEAHLPLLNMDVTLSRFVVAAPLVAVFVFVYFQLHLHVLRRAIVKLGADYASPPSGRLFPWMIHLAEEPEVGFLGKLQKLMVQFSLWWLLPLVLLLFVLFTLRQHDDGLSYFQWVLFCIGVALAFWLRNRYYAIASEAHEAQAQNIVGSTWVERHPTQLLLGTLSFGMAVFLILIVPEASRFRMSWFDIDLEGQSLIRDEKERTGVFWASLQGKQLQRANLANTVLTRANLNGSFLDAVNLEGASLDFASLYGATLVSANLSNASLKNANLRAANLSRASFICSDLSGADLAGANLSDAILINANLPNGLTSAQLSSARSLLGSPLDKDLHAEIASVRPDLFQEPLRESDVIARYGATVDTDPISKWSAEAITPSQALPVGNRNIRHRKSMAEVKRDDPIYTQLLGDRLFEEDFTAMVRRDSYSVAVVRFFVTKKKIQAPDPSLNNFKYYVQKELVSRRWLNVSCSAPNPATSK